MFRLPWSSVILSPLAAACLALSAAPVFAQPPSEVVSTAPAPSASQPTTDAQIAAWIKDAPAPSRSDDNDGVITILPDRGVHGEAGAFVSNRGYGGYVATTMPVGKDSTLGLAVADTHYNGRYFRGDSQALAANLQIGQQAPRPAGCPGAVQVGDHYVEPLWASRMRGAPLANDPDGCFGAPATGR